MTAEHHAYLVKAEARRLGFDNVGITDLSAPPHGASLTTWLERGMAGTMRYMHRQAERRLEPSRIAPGAHRAVVLTKNYYNADPPRRPGRGRVAKYARGRDYHAALREPLAQLTRYMERLGGEGTVARSYVDAGPVPERELAQRAGIGWIGKNTMLIDPRAGSFCFIATVLTNLDLAVDPPFDADRCGTCRRCLDACPTNAFPEARVLDSPRCIAYLTIEYRGEIEPEMAGLMGDWVFGCDICQDVCPWNVKFAREADDPGLGIDPALAQLDLVELLDMSDEEFDRRYGATPFERPAANGMRRNAQIAAANVALETAP